MCCRYVKTIVNSSDQPLRITSLCWSPNNQKLAVCGSDRIVSLLEMYEYHIKCDCNRYHYLMIMESDKINFPQKLQIPRYILFIILHNKIMYNYGCIL